MELIDQVFSVVRQISDSDLDDINKLHERAKNDTVTYHTDQKGIKGMYAKANKSWLLQLILIFAVPFVVSYLLSMKQRIVNKNLTTNDTIDLEDDDFEDDDENFEED